MLSHLPAAPESSSWDDIRAWRRQVRELLIAERLGMAPHVRRAQGEQAKRRLLQQIDLRQYETIGLYWSIRGEIDIRDLARKHVAAGGRVGLPVVITRGAPVEFWSWQPGAPMRRGLWDIPIPEQREVVCPRALVVPLVGFDLQCFRLGYGGGYYDRTIAAAAERPFCIGLGYGASRLPSIRPQPHDLPMDVIATDRLFIRTERTNARVTACF